MGAKTNPYKTMWEMLERRIATHRIDWDKLKLQATMKEIETWAWRDRYQEEQENEPTV